MLYSVRVLIQAALTKLLDRNVCLDDLKLEGFRFQARLRTIDVLFHRLFEGEARG